MDTVTAILIGFVMGMSGMGLLVTLYLKSRLSELPRQRVVDTSKKVLSVAVAAIIIAGAFAPLSHTSAAPLDVTVQYAPGAGAGDLEVASVYDDLFSSGFGEIQAPGVYDQIEGVAGDTSLTIPTDTIFSETNNWIVTFAPIAAIGIGITVALAVLGYLGKMIAGAFKA